MPATLTQTRQLGLGLRASPQPAPVKVTKESGKGIKRGSATAFRTLEPVLTLLNEIDDPQIRVASAIAYYCAQRIGACLHLREQDFQIGPKGGNVIYFSAKFSKTKTAHTVPICPTLKALLIQAENDGIVDSEAGFTFPTETAAGVPSVRQTNRAIEYAVTRLVKGLYDPLTGDIIKAPRPEFRGVSSHTFRRSRAQYLYYTLGWKLAEIMAITGHKSLGELQKYIAADKGEADDKYAALET